jgi:DNA-binding CsgD family transcriptional regulator
LSGAARRLTDRQQAVMERIDRRMPIKVIAQELGVSETRINQHIRALKDLYEAGSLGELVENYRATLLPAPADEPEDAIRAALPIRDIADAGFAAPFSEVAYTKKQIPQPAMFADQLERDDPGHLVLSDAMSLLEQAPWLRPGEPRVVPGVLDGEHAVLFRLGAIVGIASGILAAVVLTITAARTLSDATEGKAAISVDQMSATR